MNAGRVSALRAASPAILAGVERPLIDAARGFLGGPERAALLAAFDACVARGGREGDEIAEFERRWADKLGVRHAVATASATGGLHLLLAAHGVGAGDEVIVPAHTFAASAHAVLHAGATPVFVDIEYETLCLAPAAVEAAIGPATKAIMVVHIGGKPARMDPLLALARRHGLLVIEDAAQAHGATYRGRYAGTLGDGGVFSFSPKLMTALRGGVIVCDDDELAERCRRLRFHGLPGARGHAHAQRQLGGGGTHFVHHEPGWNMVMTSLQAALLLPQIDALDERFARRHANGTALAAALGELPGLTPVVGVPEGESNFYMLELLYDPAGFEGLDRDGLVRALTWEGVPVSPTALTGMLVYANPSVAGCPRRDCPVAEDVDGSLLVLGHPLQSSALDGDPATVAAIVDCFARVHAHAPALARHFAGGG